MPGTLALICFELSLARDVSLLDAGVDLVTFDGTLVRRLGEWGPHPCGCRGGRLCVTACSCEVDVSG
jgi:hypothetical protein